MNSNYEFNVGGTVYVKYSANQYYLIPEDSTHVIDAFRLADKGGFVDTIPYSLLISSLSAGIKKNKFIRSGNSRRCHKRNHPQSIDQFVC